MTKHARGFRAAVVLMLLAAAGLGAQPSSMHYEVKAAFLYNFANFVSWPNEAFTDARSPLYFCVLEDDPFGGALERTMEGETINGRPLEVRHVSRSASLTPCHVLFVPLSAGPAYGPMLTGVSDSTLTVGEAPEFLRAGGMINFVLDGNRVRFEVNTRATQRSRLRISSKLMRLARVSPNQATGSGR